MDVITLQRIIKEKVRPKLEAHGGDLEIVSLEGGVLTVRLLGQCSGCPSAHVTNEEIIKKEILAEAPEISDVILDNSVSEDMLAFARQLLSGKR